MVFFKGKSTFAGNNHGQYEVVHEDLPTIMKMIDEKRGHRAALFCIGHSWGGVLMNALLTRDKKLR